MLPGNQYIEALVDKDQAQAVGMIHTLLRMFVVNCIPHNQIKVHAPMSHDKKYM